MRSADETARAGTAEAAPIKASILIVDDKPNNLFALAQMLDDLNENIVQATSGADALRCLLRQDFAIVLVDVQMPDMDGYELATLIRQRERSRHMPIIFITAFGRDDQDISRGYALGAVDYVFKPIDPVITRRPRPYASRRTSSAGCSSRTCASAPRRWRPSEPSARSKSARR
jgi:CheY-like chemotaxis protein